MVCQQETRLGKANQNRDGFTQIYTGMEKGSDSNAFWLSTVTPSGTVDGEPQYFRPNDIHVLVSKPRLLALNVATRWFCARIICAHCPSAPTDDETAEDYLEEVGPYISDIIPTIVSMDGNARAHILNGIAKGKSDTPDAIRAAKRF